ncbi:unnamed protein product [Heterobilharzia americana]|nr:unnamed protein product [Heterobilharzia americana]
MSGVHKKGQPIRKNPEKRSSRPTIRLIDETGVDLTPLPLLNEEKRIREEKDIVSTEISQASNYSGSSLHITNPFTFTRSYVSGSSPTGESHSEGSEEADRYRAYTEVKTLIQSQQEILTEADLNKLVDVVIIETETFWIFDQPPTYVSQESSEAKDQIRRNEAYKALVASKIGNDRYTELGMNTFNPPSISKLVQTERIGIQEKSTMATNWDMADTYEEEKKKLLEGEHEMNSHHVNVKAGAHKTKLDENNTAHQIIKREQLQADDGGPLEDIYATGGDTAVSNPETSLEVESSQLGQSATTTTTKNTMGSNSESDIMGFRDSSISHLSQMTNVLGLLETPKMKKDLNHMERALNLNTYYDKLLKYQSLVLSRYLTQACLDQADTDPSSTVGRTPGVSVPPTLDDNSAEHAIFVSKAPGASNVPAVTSARSLGSVNPTIAGSQGASSVRTNEVAKMEDANLENPHTVPLWRFHCPLTKGHNVSDMAWNKQNPNIVAVGYGQFEYDNQRKGLVCCWSLKFIEYPERYYETPSSVTAVGWSKIHANLLAKVYVNSISQANQYRLIESLSDENFYPVTPLTFSNSQMNYINGICALLCKNPSLE